VATRAAPDLVTNLQTSSDECDMAEPKSRLFSFSQLSLFFIFVPLSTRTLTTP
jgi:hypothetical protein